MSDFNSVPPASSNQYGNQVEEGSGAEQAPASSNNSKKSENSSMQRAGSNESSKSKGDKEHSSDSESAESSESTKETSEKVGKAVEAGSFVADKMGKGGKSLTGGLKKLFGAGGNSVQQAIQQAMEAVKSAPQAIVQTIVIAVTSILVGVIAAISGGAASNSAVTADADLPVDVAYIHKGAIGSNNSDIPVDQLQREVARKIWSVMSGIDVMDHPDGLTYIDSSTGTDTGIKIQVSYGLRPEQICGLLGNWEHESGLDPTAIETCFNDSFNIGQKKQIAIMNDFIVDLWMAYDDATLQHFTTNSTIHKAGVGLAQWTDIRSYDAHGNQNNGISNPGRNTSLMTYAALYGKDYNTGWNGDDWVTLDSYANAQWYDLDVQLAYALDTSSLGDTHASWLTSTWNDVGEDLWVGDEHIELMAGTMYDDVLQGWDVNQTFNRTTGWDTSLFTIVDNKVTYNENVNAVGDNTVDNASFRGTDITLEDSNATDDYYNTPNADYVNLVNANYSAWTTDKAGSTSWTDIGSAVNYKLDGTMPSGSDAARNLAFNYANKTADLFWHGNLDTTDPLTQPLDTTHQGYQHDFLMENDPRTYDMSGYQQYYTAEEAKANDIVSLRKGGGEGVGWHYTCTTPEHDHSSGCNTASCSHSCNNDCAGGCTHTCGTACASGCTHTCGASCAKYCGHSHGTGCCSLYHQHSQSTCSWEYYYVAGYVQTGNPCDTANSFAKQQYINCFKYYYRYHLYRYMSLYYSAQFVAEYEGVPGNAIVSRFTNSNKWFNEWWKVSENDTMDYSEPNYYSPLDTTVNAYGFKDYFFRTEEGYASGIRQAIARTQDSLAWYDENRKLYNHDTLMADSANRLTFSSNRDIAVAACLIAWPQKSLSYGNDGLDAYQFIHDIVMEGDTIYQSCDRTVCTAVRWSGVDDNFPGGPTLVQMEYLVSSPRWTEICWGGDVDQLQPGDILIRKDSLASGSNLEGGGTDDGSSGGGAHHILIYTGNYFCRSLDASWASSNSVTYIGQNASSSADIVHGSFGSRSPAMDTLYNDLRSYHAFRCTDPQTASTSQYVGIQYKP